MNTVIKWDNQITAVDTDKYSIRIRTGMSVLLSNRITSFKMRQPAQGVITENRLWMVMNRISMEQLHRRSRAGFPDVRLYDIYHTTGCFTFAVVFGIVLNGGRKGRLLTGEFRFVVVTDEELDDCLSRVFEIEKLVEVSR